MFLAVAEFKLRIFAKINAEFNFDSFEDLNCLDGSMATVLLFLSKQFIRSGILTLARYRYLITRSFPIWLGLLLRLSSFYEIDKHLIDSE